jgi:hypothetical protein
MDVVVDRAQIVASSAGSLHLEGLRSDPAVDQLLTAWARGEASEADLREAERRIVAGEPLDDLLVPAASPAPPRAA